MRALVTLSAVAWLAVPAFAQLTDPTSAARERAAAVEKAAIDASLRSPLATPSFELAAEITEGKKTARAKAGISLGTGWSGELGFTGTFDNDAARSPLTSLRALTPGSSAWVAIAYKKYGLHYDARQEAIVCRQAAWAAGKRYQEFDCRESSLADQSFAGRLAALHTGEPLERGVCQQFERALRTYPEVAAGADLPGPCDVAVDVAALRTRHGARFSDSYQKRYEALPAGGPDRTELCNEFRRASGLPPERTCKAADFSDAEKRRFAESWEQRFSAVRADAEAEICDQYRRASGQPPTGKGACEPAVEDPVFGTSFRERYRATYHWLKTPLLGLRADFARPRFRYRDAMLGAHDDRHATYGVSGTAGVLFVDDTLLTLSYSAGRTWKAKDATQLCRPVPGTTASACQDGVVLGAPNETTRNQIEGQVKRYLGEDLAAALLVTRDFEKKAWGAELPLYFLKDKTGGLAGGIVFAYRSDTAEFDISVFVGKLFSVFAE